MPFFNGAMAKYRLVVTCCCTVLGLKYTRVFNHHRRFQVAEEYNKCSAQVWLRLNNSVLTAGIPLFSTEVTMLFFPWRKTDFIFTKLKIQIPVDILPSWCSLPFSWLILECETHWCWWIDAGLPSRLDSEHRRVSESPGILHQATAVGFNSYVSPQRPEHFVNLQCVDGTYPTFTTWLGTLTRIHRITFTCSLYCVLETMFCL